MKFEYDEECYRECVAFIDGEGDLCIKLADGEGLYIFTDYTSFSSQSFDEYMKDNGAKRKFYPGDKITITF